MALRASRLAVAAASTLLATIAVTGCAPDAEPGASDFTFTPTPAASPSATPTATPAARVEIPDDCRALLDDDVLAQLDGVPLNDPAFGPSGPQPDGGLICVWGDPGADATSLVTTLTFMARGAALDELNRLADDDGFTCYTPDGGTRCEKTWTSTEYPVEQGRTLFWRDDVLIDTQYSNLAPTGYTAAIVEALFE